MTTTFKDLHRGPDVLVLANCWDGASARLIASLGAKAMATTSAAVAWAHGYPDGDFLPIELYVQTIRAIKRATDLPLTADAEGGYSDDPAKAVKAVGALVAAGAVGINLEDGGSPPELLVKKIAMIKDAYPDLFVNARTDVYLRALATGDAAIKESIARATLYTNAGADGIFVPGPADEATIKALCAGIERPVNILARPGLPAAAKLKELGVRRLSSGSGLMQWAWGHIGQLAKQFLADGASDAMGQGSVPYGTINGLFPAS